jgi:hypothetical protein
VSSHLLLNESEAFESISKVPDDLRRNFVLFGIATARQRAMRQVGQSSDDWKSSQPAEPFDMKFFCAVLEAMISERSVINGILDGKSLAEASGWDV